MSLLISHGCWIGTYQSFHDWRTTIMELGEINHSPVVFLEDRVISAPDQEYFVGLEEKNIYGYWDTLPKDVLLTLILHVDNGGILQHHYLSALADRLDSLFENRDTEAAALARDFSKGLREAHSKGEDVVFL